LLDDQLKLFQANPKRFRFFPSSLPDRRGRSPSNFFRRVPHTQILCPNGNSDMFLSFPLRRGILIFSESGFSVPVSVRLSTMLLFPSNTFFSKRNYRSLSLPSVMVFQNFSPKISLFHIPQTSPFFLRKPEPSFLLYRSSAMRNLKVYFRPSSLSSLLSFFPSSFLFSRLSAVPSIPPLFRPCWFWVLEELPLSRRIGSSHHNVPSPTVEVVGVFQITA